MNRFLVPLIATAITGLLVPTSIRPAYACSCVYLTPEQQAQSADLVVVGVVNDVQFEGPINELADPLAPGEGIAHRPEISGRILAQAERYLKGTGGDILTVRQNAVSVIRDIDGSVKVELIGGPNCALFFGVPLGERYLLFLYQDEEGAYQTSWCSGSILLHPTSLPYAYTSRKQFTARLEELDAAFGLPPGTLLEIANSPAPSFLPLPETDNGGLPWLPIALASTLGAIALLAASAFLLRRRIMGRDDNSARDP